MITLTMDAVCVCIVCKRPIDDIEKSADKCRICNKEFCLQCYESFCNIGGGQDQDIYFSCPHCTAEIFTDSDLLEYFLAKHKMSKDIAAMKYKKWKLKTRYEIEIVQEYDFEKQKYKQYLNLSYDKAVPNSSLMCGIFNKNSCGGACDWSIAYRPMEDAIYSTRYDGEKYFYIFSFYQGVDESCDLYKLMMRLFPKAEDMGNGMYVATVIDNKLPEEMTKIYDHENETLVDIDPDKFGGLIYFSYIE